MHGAAVEVRKNPTSTTWYEASLLDVKGEAVRVGFEYDVWASREVPAHSVRPCPDDGTSDDFDPQVDEIVEVMVKASESNPCGWSQGRIKTIKNDFYFVAFIGNTKGTQDTIVEKDALRRVNAQDILDVSKFVRKLIPLEPELHDWIRSQDSAGCLSNVQQKAGLLICSSTMADPPDVILVGDSNAVDLAEKLLTMIHFKNQMEMQRFHNQREQLIERLSECKEWYTSKCSEVFIVDQSLTGKIIGAKGKNINEVRERHGVEVTVTDVPASANRKGTAKVTITGDSEAAIKKAREELEYITVSIPVAEDQIGWILGKGFQNITDIAKKTELHYARFDDNNKSLELCGRRQQVEDAKLLISVHREYLPVYQDMDEETAAIQESFDKLDNATGGPRKGKKGGKGGDEDDDKNEEGYSSTGRGGRGDKRKGSGRGRKGSGK